MESEKINQIVAMYENNISCLQISKILNIKYKTVLKILRNQNIEIRSNKINSRKYFVENSIFKNINTEEKAYWLGFLYADGYLTSSKKQKLVGLSLSIKDINHLNKFKDFLNTNYPINIYNQKSGYSKNEYCRILITSEEMFNDLFALGCTTNKTLTLTFPEIPSELIIHFIRGYFDGDGSICVDKKTKQGFSFRLEGTKEMLSFIMTFFDKPRKLAKRKKDNKNNYTYPVSGFPALEIFRKLYSEATILMDRKYNRYLIMEKNEAFK